MLELSQYLILLVLNSLTCLGIYAVCDYEIDIETNEPTKYMLFWWVKYYGIRNFGHEVFMRPICGCMTCMASLHSLWFFVPMHFPAHMDSRWITTWIIYMLALAGLNSLVHRLHERLL